MEVVVAYGKPAVQRAAAGIHGRNLKGSRIEEGECEVDMGETVKVEVFW